MRNRKQPAKKKDEGDTSVVASSSTTQQKPQRGGVLDEQRRRSRDESDSSSSSFALQTYGGPTVREKFEDRSSTVGRRFGMLSMILFIVVVGLPIWIKTTEVYRADLPYNQIARLEKEKITFLVPIKIFLLESESSFFSQASPGGATVSDLQALFRQRLKKTTGILVSSRGITNEYVVDVKFVGKANGIELPKAVQDLTLEDLDSTLPGVINCAPGQHAIWVAPDSSAKLASAAGGETKLFVGGDRHSLIAGNGVGDSASKFVDVGLPVISKFVLNVLADVEAGENRQMEGDALQDSTREFQPAPKYQLLFSLLNGDAETYRIRWDLEKAFRVHLEPLLLLLKPLCEFEVSTQIIHGAKLPFKTTFESKNGVYVLKESQLPNFIHPAWNLITPVSQDPLFNFAIYVPRRDASPLHILLNDQSLSETNSFSFPQWGGIHIHNVVGKNETLGRGDTYSVHLDLETSVSVLITHLRWLLGIKAIDEITKDTKGIVRAGSKKEFVALYELDILYRKKMGEMLYKSVHSLASLSKLLSTISKMVIVDELAGKVDLAVRKIVEAKQLLAKGQFMEALNSTKLAYSTSDKAFFDPSVLEMLYFPEENKFAIYIPLFVPMFVPILAGVISEFKKVWISDVNAPGQTLKD
eukprot:Nk52_evm5s210 gene=Nk52_evmTU5s210